MGYPEKISERVGVAPLGSFYYNCPQHICVTSPYFSTSTPNDYSLYFRTSWAKERRRAYEVKRNALKKIEVEAVFLR